VHVLVHGPLEILEPMPEGAPRSARLRRHLEVARQLSDAFEGDPGLGMIVLEIRESARGSAVLAPEDARIVVAGATSQVLGLAVYFWAMWSSRLREPLRQVSHQVAQIRVSAAEGNVAVGTNQELSFTAHTECIERTSSRVVENVGARARRQMMHPDQPAIALRQQRHRRVVPGIAVPAQHERQVGSDQRPLQ
jgi:hypothetical protein